VTKSGAEPLALAEPLAVEVLRVVEADSELPAPGLAGVAALRAAAAARRLRAGVGVEERRQEEAEAEVMAEPVQVSMPIAGRESTRASPAGLPRSF